MECDRCVTAGATCEPWLEHKIVDLGTVPRCDRCHVYKKACSSQFTNHPYRTVMEGVIQRVFPLEYVDTVIARGCKARNFPWPTARLPVMKEGAVPDIVAPGPAGAGSPTQPPPQKRRRANTDGEDASARGGPPRCGRSTTRQADKGKGKGKATDVGPSMSPEEEEEEKPGTSPSVRDGSSTAQGRGSAAGASDGPASAAGRRQSRASAAFSAPAKHRGPKTSPAKPLTGVSAGASARPKTRVWTVASEGKYDADAAMPDYPTPSDAVEDDDARSIRYAPSHTPSTPHYSPVTPSLSPPPISRRPAHAAPASMSTAPSGSGAAPGPPPTIGAPPPTTDTEEEQRRRDAYLVATLAAISEPPVRVDPGPHLDYHEIVRETQLSVIAHNADIAELRERLEALSTSVAAHITGASAREARVGAQRGEIAASATALAAAVEGDVDEPLMGDRAFLEGRLAIVTDAARRAHESAMIIASAREYRAGLHTDAMLLLPTEERRRAERERWRTEERELDVKQATFREHCISQDDRAASIRKLLYDLDRRAGWLGPGSGPSSSAAAPSSTSAAAPSSVSASGISREPSGSGASLPQPSTSEDDSSSENDVDMTQPLASERVPDEGEGRTADDALAAEARSGDDPEEEFGGTEEQEVAAQVEGDEEIPGLGAA